VVQLLAVLLVVLAPAVLEPANNCVSAGGGGTDVGPTCALGVVCSGLNVLDPRLTSDTNNPCTADAMGVWGPPSYDASNPQLYDSQYFWVHHSEADTMERVDPRQLNHGAAALAVWAYAISQLPTLLPRDAPAPPAPAPAAAAASDSGVTAIAGGAAGGLAAVALLGYFAATRGGALVKSVCGGGGGRKDEYAPV